MSVTISGGAGGLAADLEAMRAAAEALARVGRSTALVGVRVSALSFDTDLVLIAPLDPAGFARVQRHLLPLVAGPSGVAACAGRVTLLAGQVASAAVLYAAAERTATELAQGLRDGAAEVAGVGTGVVVGALAPELLLAAGLATSAWVTWRAAPLLWDEVRLVAVDVGSGRFRLESLDDRFLRYVGRGGAVLKRDTEAVGIGAVGWMAQHPELTEGVVGATPAFLDGLTGPLVVPGSLTPGGLADPLWPPDDVRELAAVLSCLGAHAPLLVGGDVTVSKEKVLTPAPQGPGVVGALQRLVRYSPALEPDDVQPRTPWRQVTSTVPVVEQRIRVERIVRDSGVHWAVYIPPTQTWSVTGGVNPFDGSTNIRSVGGRQTAAAAAVAEALDAADVPTGQPVMLSGYSQGGLTALQLAGDKEFRQRFNVEAVLTAGSPVAGLDVPDDVAVLSIENEQDLVPALDGAPNPDRPNWVTVRRDLVDDLGTDVTEDLSRNPSTAHRIEYYLDTGALVDDSEDESVRGWLEATEPFLDTTDAGVLVREYFAERTDP